jgi:hypothetical protein
MAGFLKKGFNFARAYVKWATAGKPLRDDEYIFEIFDNHCGGCELFIPTNKEKTHGECDSCGCIIKRVSASDCELNKLAWPTEGCPEGLWPADIDEPE